MRFGVIRFPGSCDEMDALLACRRYADAELLWHGDRELRVDVVARAGEADDAEPHASMIS